LDWIEQYVWIGALLFTRIGAVLMLAPGWGEVSVPATIRLAAALLATAALAPALAGQAPPPPGDVFAAAPMIASEAAVGIVLASGVRVMMGALQVAGATVGLASGLAFAQQVDPAMGQPSAVFSAFFSLTGLVLVMAAGLHRVMLEAAAASYQVFPPGEIPMLGDAAQHMIAAVSESFKLGIQIAAPVLVFSFAFNLALGLASRLTPQVQMFMVAQPAAVLGSVAILAIGFSGGLMVWLEAVERNVRYFAPG
jgi:flagellar biosynthesis protein FliR